MTIAWNHACGEMVELAGALKAAADAHPVAECCEPPHLRHQLEFDNGIRICFTR
ncbi:MAG: hypothetical protein HYT22_03800, partial [Candidatus Niyogibacteria bacterium]|nr:hypothetical protein [Candidatus Niyogibacteria bacterium]